MALSLAPVLPRNADDSETCHFRLAPAKVPVSATLAANETMDARLRRGEPVC